MSGTANVPTLFAAAVTATGQQLDNNFSTVVAYLNDPTNRNNFAVSSGTGTYVVSISPAPGGYTAGLEITFQAGNTNTAAVALNVNGLGVVNVLNQDSSAITTSQIIANGVYKVVHNGTNFSLLGAKTIFASQNDIQNTVSGNIALSASSVKYAPGYIKAWGSFASSGSTGSIGLNGGYGMYADRRGTGTYNIIFSVPFGGANFLNPPLFNAIHTGAIGISMFQPSGGDTSTFTIVMGLSSTGVKVDPAGGFSIIFLGGFPPQ